MSIVNKEDLFQLLIKLQKTIEKPLSPCTYIQLTRFTDAPTLEEVIESLGPWSKIEKKLHKEMKDHYEKKFNEICISIIQRRCQNSFTKEEALDVLAQYKNEKGELISLPKYEKWRRQQKREIPSAYQIRDLFGTWEEICKNVGLRVRTRYTKLQLLYFVSAACEDYGKYPNSEEYHQWALMNRAPALKTIISHYGSWEDAIYSLNKLEN